jgi:hypothetical protein
MELIILKNLLERYDTENKCFVGYIPQKLNSVDSIESHFTIFQKFRCIKNHYEL